MLQGVYTELKTIYSNLEYVYEFHNLLQILLLIPVNM
jgi:hypothetical protein